MCTTTLQVDYLQKIETQGKSGNPRSVYNWYMIVKVDAYSNQQINQINQANSINCFSIRGLYP